MHEIQNFIGDVEKMIPESSRKYIHWEQTHSEQEPWPTKNIVSMWFKSETNLPVMIEHLRSVKDDFKKGPYTIQRREVVSRLESSSQQKPLKRAPCKLHQMECRHLGTSS